MRDIPGIAVAARMRRRDDVDDLGGAGAGDDPDAVAVFLAAPVVPDGLSM
ncbi:hypothetical protein [Pseudogemmobacter bohemicus]|nr:hypothetical protein [Pseudogemmobacter bohemicus]